MHLRRYRQIAEVLVRHGLGYLVGVFGLERFVPFHRGLLGHARRAEPYTRPEHVRLALEELGTTFIKLGQILSTRPDLLPPEYLRELSRLQDEAPPVAPEEVLEVVEAELGRPAGEAFARFEAEPLAAASIGQAHAAALHDGTEVVVKVRRPGVVERVHEDIEILKNLAAAASRRWEAAQRYDLVGLADEFGETLRAELDYVREGRNAERFARNFAGDPAVHIPRIFWEVSTSRVLTLERIRGAKITDASVLGRPEAERRALARRAARIVLRMVFQDGFFHADPHPGNFFVEEGGRIGIVDFGMVGAVDSGTREDLARMLTALTRRDAAGLVDGLVDLGVSRGGMDRDRLEHDLDAFLSRYYDRPLAEIPLGPVLEELLAIIRRHQLQLSSDLALLLKMLIMSEGLGLRLDPDFRLVQEITPFAERLVLRQYDPTVWARRLGHASLDAARLATELPRDARQLIDALERGRLELGLRHESLEPLGDRLERLANRVVLAILASAFIVALAVLVLLYPPRGWERWAGAAFVTGFAIAAVLGLYLAWTILRSRGG